MKKGGIAILLACVTVIATILSPFTTVAATNASYVSLGADLTAEQKKTVLGLLKVSAEELNDDNSVIVTNADEHKYLDSFLDSSVIGTRALSSCKVTAAENGHGIQVETHNITYVTASMFQNALATAGMKNADVVVAGPVPISGTAALVGAMQAYAKMSGQVIEPTILETASEELVTSGEIAESLGDADKSAELIAAVKQIIAENDIEDEDDIRQIIIDIALQLNINLTESDTDKLVALMKKLAQLDLDASDLAEQARSVYEAARNSGLDLTKYGISESEVSGFFAALPGIFQAFIDWLRSIFS